MNENIERSSKAERKRKEYVEEKRNKEIDLDKYSLSDLKQEQPKRKETLQELEEADIKTISNVGVHLKETENHSGTYLLCDTDVFTLAEKNDGFECLPIALALQKYPWLGKKYWFKAVKKETDKYTAALSEIIPRGYFIHVKKGVKIEKSFQAALYTTVDNSAMGVHNIIILEEGAELHIITGCTNAKHVHRGVHLGITEAYVGKNANLTCTMVHNWGSELEVRPRSATIVSEGGNFSSNYYSLNPPRHIQMDPYTHLKGKNSKAKYTTILIGKKGTICDIGGTVLLEGENSAAEYAARAVCQGGDVVQTGALIGAGKNCRAHVDCSGMILSDSGMIDAIPGLRAIHPDARMSHEASIGKINTGEVSYLQTRGLTEEEAISLIVRGFLDIGIGGLSEELDKAISEIAEISGHGEE